MAQHITTTSSGDQAKELFQLAQGCTGGQKSHFWNFHALPMMKCIDELEGFSTYVGNTHPSRDEGQNTGRRFHIPDCSIMQNVENDTTLSVPAWAWENKPLTHKHQQRTALLTQSRKLKKPPS